MEISNQNKADWLGQSVIGVAGSALEQNISGQVVSNQSNKIEVGREVCRHIDGQ